MRIVYGWTVTRKSSNRAPRSLRLAREDVGVSQEAVAERFGVSQASVSHWETGKAAPHPRIWSDLAKIYGVTTDDLFRWFRSAGVQS